MKILNISTIVPLKGLRRENDIVLRIQDHLRKTYGYHFQMAKSLPYTPNVFSKFSSKWAKYRELQVGQEIDLEGYKTLIYPWVAPPSSRLLMNYPLIPINWIRFKLQLQKNWRAGPKIQTCILLRILFQIASWPIGCTGNTASLTS